MSVLRTFAALVILLGLLGFRVARADVATPSANPPANDDMARARSHFDAGQALYQLGRYGEAATEFSASYSLTHRPALILNIGSCYRKMGDPAAARDVFKKFLEEAPAQDPYRPQVVKLLGEIDAEIAARPQPTPEPQPQPEAQLTPAPVAAPVLVETPPPRSFMRRNWWVVPVAAVVVAGVAVGIYFGVHDANKPSCGSTSLGCVTP